MADAGVLRAGDRLPWLEPYRAPKRKTSNRKAGFAALVGVAGLAGVATMLAVGVVRLPDIEQRPTAEITLPPPAATTPEPVQTPVAEDAVAPTIETAAADVRRPVAAPYRRHVTRRRIKAEPTRDAFGKVVSEQSGEIAAAEPISPEAMAIAIATLPPPPAPAVDPPRPAVNPRARVVRGKTVQLGVFKTQRQAEIAWRSAIRDYTYLVTMPKSIEPIRIRSRTYYRLQLGTPSQNHAKQLCGNLREIGRTCRVA